MNWRKISVVLCLSTIVLSGCNKATETLEGDAEKVQVTQEVGNESTGNIVQEVEKKEEPTLSEAAKKITQFKEAKKGDTIAEIIVKDYGKITIKLFEKYAPKAVENFTTHAKEGYYDGVTFHRVISDFMIQGGDPSGDGTGGQSIWDEPFKDEFSKELKPVRGALCMANSGPDTNGSQFFIVQADDASVKNLEYLLNERYEQSLIDYVKEGFGVTISQEDLARYETYGGTPWLQGKHTVFGQTIDGFEVLDAIASSEVIEGSDIPKQEVTIESIRIYEKE